MIELIQKTSLWSWSFSPGRYYELSVYNHPVGLTLALLIYIIQIPCRVINVSTLPWTTKYIWRSFFVSLLVLLALILLSKTVCLNDCMPSLGIRIAPIKNVITLQSSHSLSYSWKTVGTCQLSMRRVYIFNPPSSSFRCINSSQFPTKSGSSKRFLYPSIIRITIDLYMYMLLIIT